MVLFVSFAAMTLGERIKQSRLGLGLSQRKLATFLNISFQTVQAWESGRAQPKGSRIAEVAEVLSVSVGWLLTGAGSSEYTAVNPDDLTMEEIAMLEQFRSLPPEKRKMIQSVAHAMAESEVKVA